MRGTLGFLILLSATMQPALAQVTSVRIGRVTPTVDPRMTMESEEEFLTTDPFVQYLVTFNTQGGDRLRTVFLDPMGKVAQETPARDAPLGSGTPAIYWRLGIAGSPHAFQPGEWQVRTY